MKREAFAAAALSGALLAAGCTGPEASDQFSAVGTVTMVDHDEVTIDDITVTEEQGGADGYLQGNLDDGSHVQLSASIGMSTVNCLGFKPHGYEQRAVLISLSVDG